MIKKIILAGLFLAVISQMVSAQEVATTTPTPPSGNATESPDHMNTKTEHSGPLSNDKARKDGFKCYVCNSGIEGQKDCGNGDKSKLKKFLVPCSSPAQWGAARLYHDGESMSNAITIDDSDKTVLKDNKFTGQLYWGMDSDTANKTKIERGDKEPNSKSSFVCRKMSFKIPHNRVDKKGDKETGEERVIRLCGFLEKAGEKLGDQNSTDEKGTEKGTVTGSLGTQIVYSVCENVVKGGEEGCNGAPGILGGSKNLVLAVTILVFVTIFIGDFTQ